MVPLRSFQGLGLRVQGFYGYLGYRRFRKLVCIYGSFRNLGVPYFGGLMIRILLFRVPY